MKRLLAPFIFFTRLPFWRIADVEPHYFKRVVELWPLVGWLTGGITALMLWTLSHLLPIPVAVVAAYAVRLLVTGALHEDGLADYLDGMGGGSTRGRVLEIMKDSHIGSYGVIGLIVYFLLLTATVASMPVDTACMAVLAADVWSKFSSSQIINVLPYARKEEEAKSKTVYSRMTPAAWAVSFVIGGISLWLLPLELLPAAPVATAASFMLMWQMKRRIAGYTGDCCGATFLITELTFLLAARVSMTFQL